MHAGVWRIPWQGNARTRECQWLVQHAAAYRGQWVAVYGEQCLGSAETLQALLGVLKAQTLPGMPLVCRVCDSEDT